jgi:hypothetical protein
MRIENWRSNLLSFLDSQEREPFGFGTNDCLLMTAGAVAAVTGVDHAEPYRGRYSTMRGGKRVIGMSPLQLVASKFPEIHPSEARDGDIAAKMEGDEWSFGVIVGAHFYVRAPDWLGILPRGQAEKAYRVE